MKNKVLITGTSRGIGKALKLAFEERGDIVIDYKRSSMGDLRFESTIDMLSNVSEKKKVNILINCAGVYSEKTLLEIEDDELIEVIAVNLLVPMQLTKKLWLTLVKNKGTVVNINSIAGRKDPNEREIVYRASKFGLTGFSHSLAAQGVKDGVRVIDIPLGAVNTDMKKGMPKIKDPKLQPEVAANLIIDMISGSAFEEKEHHLIYGRVIDNGRVMTNGGKS